MRIRIQGDHFNADPDPKHRGISIGINLQVYGISGVWRLSMQEHLNFITLKSLVSIAGFIQRVFYFKTLNEK